jgi:Fe-S-cluster formation regulator IscX/YfhJ
LYEDETGDEDVSNIIWDGDPTTLNFGLALASWILGLPDVDDKKAQAIIDILWRFYR